MTNSQHFANQLAYFLVDLVLPSLLTTKQSISHSLVVNVELMLAILQFSSYRLLICIALLLSDEFGEFKGCRDLPYSLLANRTPSFCLIYHCLVANADKFGELATFSRFIKFAILATCDEGPLVFL